MMNFQGLKTILVTTIAFLSCQILFGQSQDTTQTRGIEPPEPSNACTFCASGINTGDHSSILGIRCQATAAQAFASGLSCEASGNYSTSFGYYSTAAGNSSLAAGYYSEANGSYSVALGRKAIAGYRGVALGDEVESGSSGVTIGRYLRAAAGESFVIGRGYGATNKIVNNITGSIMMGTGSSVPTFFIGKAPKEGETGNVGIGTTDPRQKLHVKGNVLLTGRNSSILFADETRTGDWGEWGIEYNDGGLNF